MRLPELKWKLGVDPAGVKHGSDEAKRSVKSLDDSFAAMASKAAKTGAKVAAAWAAIKAATLAVGVVAAKTAVEIDNMARVANTTPEVFQRWAAAARSVGVDQDKLSSILQDTTDRVGEFLSTGSGPMADFFDNIAPKIGVTAAQFANLSGPDALQLYVSSLEAAGLGQQQMTYYLEAMSGDLVRLLPLLRNGGADLKALGDAAQNAGQILDDDMIRAGREMDRVFDEISTTLSTAATRAVLEHKDELMALANWISETAIPTISALVTEIGKITSAFGTAGGAVRRFWNTWSGIDTEGPGAVADPGSAQDLTDDSRTPTTTGTWPLDKNGNVILDGGETLASHTPPALLPYQITGPSGDNGGGNKGKNGSGRGAEKLNRDLDRLREQFATETELLDLHLARQLEKLTVFREAKLLGETELAELEQRIRTDHHEKMAEIDAKAAETRRMAWSGALGDIASLMSTNSKKLFNIGKTAAIAQATVDGWSSAVSAYKKGVEIGGPALGGVYAAMSMARTGAMIASISSTQMGGGGGSGGASGSAVQSAAPTSAPLDVRLRGDGSPIGWGQLGDLLKKLDEEAGDRGYRLMVAK